MICLDKLRQAYMLGALNIKEAHSKQSKQKYNDAPNYKIDDLVMIRNIDKKSKWDTKYIPNFKVVCLIGSSQLKVFDPSGRIRKINVCDVHKILPSDDKASSIPDKEVFGIRGKCINEPHIVKEVVIRDAFLHENFPHVRIKQK